MERNRELVRRFVTCALPLLDGKCGEVHVAHKTKPPYNQWSLEKVALEGLMSKEEEAEEEEEEEEEEDNGRGGTDGVVDEDSGIGIGGYGEDDDPASTRRRRRRRRRRRTLEYKGRMVFDKCIYRPYTPRKALDRKSFPCHDACVYVFGWKEEEEDDDDDDRWTTIPRTTVGSSHDDDDDEILQQSESSSSVMPVTMELIDRIRSIHLARAKERKIDDGRRPAAADCIDAAASSSSPFPSIDERNGKRNDGRKRQRRKK